MRTVMRTNKTLIPSGSVIDGNDGKNYDVTFENNTTGSITQAGVLTVVGLIANNKVYDGTTNVIFDTSNASLSGEIGSDQVTLDTSAISGAFAIKMLARPRQ